MLLVKENRLIRDVEYKRDPMYYRTKVDKLRTRLSAIPLVTRIDPTVQLTRVEAVSIDPIETTIDYSSLWFPFSRNNQPRDYQLSSPPQRTSSLTNVHKKFRNASPPPLNDQVLFDCIPCQAISHPLDNLWRHFCIHNDQTHIHPQRRKRILDASSKITLLSPCFPLFLFFLFLSRVFSPRKCNASPRLISLRLWPSSFPFPTKGIYIYISVKWCHYASKHLSIFRLSFHFSPLVRRWTRPRAFVLLPKKRIPVRTSIRITACNE